MFAKRSSPIRVTGRSCLVACIYLAISGLATAAAAADEIEPVRALLEACGLRSVSVTPAGQELVVTFSVTEQIPTNIALAIVALTAEDLIAGYEAARITVLREGQETLRVRTTAAGLLRLAQKGAGTDGMARAREIIAKAGGSEGSSGGGEPRLPRPPGPPTGASAEALAQELVTAGLENVSVAATGSGEWVISYENRAYRSDAEAMGIVQQIASKTMGQTTRLRVVARRDDVPVIALELPSGSRDVIEASKDWSLPADGVTDRADEMNPSFQRVDLAVRPELRYELGNERKQLITDWYLLPTFSTTLARGLRASVRSRIHLDDPELDLLDRALLTYTGRFASHDILWTASVGKFQDRRQGIYGEAQYQFGGGPAATGRIGLRLARVGQSLTDFDRPLWVGYYEHDVGSLGLTLRASAGRFLGWGEPTGLVELDRRFGESTLSAGVTLGAPQRVGVVRVSMPLGPRRLADPASFRLRPSDYYELGYRSSPMPGVDALQGDQDLRAFRGELTEAFLTAHPERLHGQSGQLPDELWPTGPSQEGMTGLIRIPTADVIADGAWRFGVSYIDRAHTRGRNAGKSPMVPVFINIGLLPRLETAFRYTVFPDLQAFNWKRSGDRSLAFQYQLWPQSGGRPAVAIGAQDMAFSNDAEVLGRMEYLVATRQQGRMRAHLGIARNRLSGVFWGLEYMASERLIVMAEYDTEWFNIGLRAAPNRSWRVDLGLTDRSGIGGVVSYQAAFP